MNAKIYEEDLKKIIRLYGAEVLEVNGEVKLERKTVQNDGYHQIKECVATLYEHIPLDGVNIKGEVTIYQKDIEEWIRKRFEGKGYAVDKVKLNYQFCDQRDPGYYYAEVEFKAKKRERGNIY